MTVVKGFPGMHADDWRRIAWRTVVNIILSQVFVFGVLHAANADALLGWGAFFAFVCPLALTPYFTWKDVTAMRQLERYRQQLERVNDELKLALSEVKELRGLLPICAACKKIRNDEGLWDQLEVYISRHTKAEFSHSICPDCRESLYQREG